MSTASALFLLAGGLCGALALWILASPMQTPSATVGARRSGPRRRRLAAIALLALSLYCFFPALGPSTFKAVVGWLATLSLEGILLVFARGCAARE
ncbi:MAG: hypothetical protein ACK5HY_16260 [Parahaliea sp.]